MILLISHKFSLQTGGPKSNLFKKDVRSLRKSHLTNILVWGVGWKKLGRWGSEGRRGSECGWRKRTCCKELKKKNQQFLSYHFRDLTLLVASVHFLSIALCSLVDLGLPSFKAVVLPGVCTHSLVRNLFCNYIKLIRFAFINVRCQISRPRTGKRNWRHSFQSVTKSTLDKRDQLDTGLPF